MGLIKDFLGVNAGDAAEDAANIQAAAGERGIDFLERGTERGLGFYEPFGGIAQRAVDLSGFLADPQAQFDFLQSNPLFQMSLDQLNQGTAAQAAARGRLSAGDTLQQLTNNTMLAAMPLIDRQRQDIGNLLNLGSGIAGSQAATSVAAAPQISNLITDIGAAQAGGIVGAQNARNQGLNNLMQLGGMLALSDSRLKVDLEIVGQENGYDIYQWNWNELAFDKFDLSGSAKGVMSIDVREKNPEAIHNIEGFDVIDYGAIGITPEYFTNGD